MSNDDPRTRQFADVMVAAGSIFTTHALSLLVAVFSNSIVSRGYLAWVCIVIPLCSGGLAIRLIASRKWHWGQAVMLAAIAILLGAIQLLIVGSASASV
jgi:lysylphosphatidylglycerol synthetase-like protein (DUF2156 family)